MSADIRQLTSVQAKQILSGLNHQGLEEKAMDFCLLMSTQIWGGFVNGEPICIYGVIPPSLMSNQAYLWLYTTGLLKEHQFILVRHSQMVIESVLKEYPSIVGHAVLGADKSIRWLRWLGAKFGHPQGNALPFRIERPHREERHG